MVTLTIRHYVLAMKHGDFTMWMLNSKHGDLTHQDGIFCSKEWDRSKMGMTSGRLAGFHSLNPHFHVWTPFNPHVWWLHWLGGWVNSHKYNETHEYRSNLGTPIMMIILDTYISICGPIGLRFWPIPTWVIPRLLSPLMTRCRIRSTDSPQRSPKTGGLAGCSAAAGRDNVQMGPTWVLIDLSLEKSIYL